MTASRGQPNRVEELHDLCASTVPDNGGVSLEKTVSELTQVASIADDIGASIALLLTDDRDTMYPLQWQT